MKSKIQYITLVDSGYLGEHELEEHKTNEERIKDSKELRRCPFCGEKGFVDYYTTDKMARGDELYHDIFFVVCTGCCAQGPEQFTRESAISAWNKRNRVPLMPGRNKEND